MQILFNTLGWNYEVFGRIDIVFKLLFLNLPFND